MNTSLFLLINSWAGMYPWLDAVMVFSAHYLIYVLVLLVLWYGHHWRRWRDMVIVSLGSAVVARWGVASAIRFLYYHPRPYWVLDHVRLLLDKEVESSFPSGHTIFAFALAAGVYFYNKRMGKWLFAAATLIGFSRVFVGVHWPYDIVGGIILGIPTAWVCHRIYNRYFKHLVEGWL